MKVSTSVSRPMRFGLRPAALLVLILLICPLAKSSAQPVRLSPEESAWLEAHPVITLAIDDGYPPKNYRDSSGEMTGLTVDYLRLIEKRIGTRIRFIGSSWEQAISRGMAHEVDGVINADKLPERENRLDFTEYYVRYPQALVTREADAPVESITLFSGRRVAAKSGSSQLAVLADRYPEIEIVPVETVEDGLFLLIERIVDGVFDDLAVIHYHISQLNLSDLAIATVSDEPPVGYSRIGVRNDQPLLTSILNRAIASITDADRRRIHDRWLSPQLFAPERVTLDLEEREWLRNHRTVTFAIDPNWAPIEFVAEDGNAYGLSVEVLEAVSKIIGIQFLLVRTDDREETCELVINGEVDLAPAVQSTPGREQILEFTAPYVSVGTAIFTRDDVAYVASAEALSGNRIAIVGGSAIQELLELEYPDLQIVTASNVSDALTLLSHGEVEAFIGNVATGSHYLATGELASIKVSGSIPNRYELSIAVAAGRGPLATILDKALRAIPKDEHRLILTKWLSGSLEQSRDYSGIWKIAIVAACVLAVVAGVMLLWNRRMARAVSVRTEALAKTNAALEGEVDSRSRVQAALTESEERFRAVFETAPDAIFLIRHMAFVGCNPATHKLFGAMSDEELIGLHPADLSPEKQPDGSDSQTLSSTMIEAALEGTLKRFDWRHARLDGTEFDATVTLAPATIGGERLVLGIVRDITQQRQVEAEYRQAQKMEAVGRLAGGVAHDFNNLLQVIGGYADMVAEEVSHLPEAAEGIGEIARATDRASTLVRQLLTFSRKGNLGLETVDLDDLIRNLIRMIERIIGEDVEVQFYPAEQETRLLADPGQIEQILVNLCINSRDAMEAGGTISIETGTLDLAPGDPHVSEDVQPGRFVMLQVADTGTGIPEEIQTQVFEPFFTTKHPSRGTGLGLSTVYGIVRNHGGFVDLWSQTGVGTTFKAFFPVGELEAGSERTVRSADSTFEAGNGETVLLAEDDEQVRRLAGVSLRMAGYEVVETHDGFDAVDRFNEYGDQIQVAILDAVMPRKSGIEVYRELAGRAPELRFIFVSGYSFNLLEDTHYDGRVIATLEKPYDRRELLRTVRRAIEAHSTT